MISEKEYTPPLLIKPEDIEGIQKREEDKLAMQAYMEKYCAFYDLPSQTLEQGLQTTVWRGSKSQIETIREMQATIVLHIFPQPYELVTKYLHSVQNTSYAGLYISGGNRIGHIYINNQIPYPSRYFDAVRNHESIHALNGGDSFESGFHRPFAFGTNLNEATTELLRIYGELCQWVKDQYWEVGDVYNAIAQEEIPCYESKEILLLMKLLQNANLQDRPVVPWIASLSAQPNLSANQKCVMLYDVLKTRKSSSLSDETFELMWAALMDDFTDWENLYHLLET